MSSSNNPSSHCTIPPMPPLTDDDLLYIDPRLLEQTGGAIEIFLPETATQPRDDLELDVDLEMVFANFPDHPDEFQGEAEEKPTHNIRSDEKCLSVPTPPPRSPLGSSSLRPDAQEFVPNRPRLALETGQQELLPSPRLGTSPVTPKIKVLAPVDGNGASKAHAERRSQSRSRQRRKSSPGARPSPSLMRRQGSRGPNNGLLSPIRAGRWVIQHSYHAGDRSRSMHAPVTVSTPPDVACVPVMASPSTSSPSAGPYYCSYLDCKKRDKGWDTQSELRKHEHIHFPKDQRPYGCSECPRRFWYPKDIRRHMQAKHQLGTSWICEICGKALSRDDNLQRHKEKIHGDMQTPSASAESSVASPASATSVSNFSDIVSSDTPPSTAHTSPWAQVKTASRAFQQRLQPFLDESEYPPLGQGTPSPTSHPMSRWRTN